MTRQILIIEIAVGYMLKVIKSGKKISKFKNEFAAIRHGDYYNFIKLVGGKIPFMVTYHLGQVYVDDKNNETDIDFAGLLKAGDSLKIFYENCIEFYGEIIDNDVPDSVYCKLAYFEISLRMHANNHKLLKRGDTLELVIDKVASNFNLTNDEKILLQSGRRFLNMVKHFKGQFPTWTDGIKSFLKALTIIEKRKLTVI